MCRRFDFSRMSLIATAILIFMVAGCSQPAPEPEPEPEPQAQPQPQTESDTALLHPLFQDHAVLQRDRPLEIWGTATPGATLSVSLAKETATATAGTDGSWRAELPALAAGGPHTLSVSSDSGAAQLVRDVMVGDVWLCSGQSNMALPVRRTLDADSEIANAANETIRMLTVRHAASMVPMDRFADPVEWQPASPETVPEFSAACFYFARELQRTVDVPMGLIHSSWGGSRIETWMSRDAIRAAGGSEQQLEILEQYASDPAQGARRWGAEWEAWWHSRAGDAPDPWAPTSPDQGWRRVPSLGFWNHWDDPELTHFTGMVWFRTKVDLTAEQAAQKATLSLGTVDEIEQTWVNGTAVGGGSGGDRSHGLPPGTLRAGENTIVVNVLNTWRLGGLVGPAEKQGIQFSDGTKAPLSGPWFYRIVPLEYGHPPRPPWEALAGPGMAYHAMIAPLGRTGLRGVLWYQGESNTGDAETYGKLLSGLIADWRGRFGDDLPFLIVQLAGFGKPPVEPHESGWARLRDAQRRVAAKDERVGLVVAFDIGDRYDIHPPNKQEVGRRLARAARKVVYGEEIIPSGPVAAEARQDGDSVVVGFADIEAELVAYGGTGPMGFEVCGGEPMSCRYVGARIEGEDVRLALDGAGAPSLVRYCWADNPVCTLFDRSGLPAGPFEIPVEAATP